MRGEARGAGLDAAAVEVLDGGGGGRVRQDEGGVVDGGDVGAEELRGELGGEAVGEVVDVEVHGGLVGEGRVWIFLLEMWVEVGRGHGDGVDDGARAFPGGTGVLLRFKVRNRIGQ